MPYVVRKNRNKPTYKVVNIENGYVHAKGTTKAKAEAQMRLLNQIEAERGGPSRTAMAKLKKK